MRLLIASLVVGLLAVCTAQSDAQCQSGGGSGRYGSRSGFYGGSYSSGCGSYSSGCGATYSSGCGSYSGDSSGCGSYSSGCGATYSSGCSSYSGCGVTYGNTTYGNGNKYYYGYPMLSAVGTTGAHTWDKRLDGNNNPFVEGKEYKVASNGRSFIYTGGYFYPVEDEAVYGGSKRFQEGQAYQFGDKSYLYTGGVFRPSTEQKANTKGNPLNTPLVPAPGLPDFNEARKATGSAGSKG